MKTPILEQPTLGHRPLSEPMFERVALIGIGLIGSSISHAARRANLARSIVGSARTAETVETAMRLGIIDNGYATAAEAAKGADLVILCVPVGAMGASPPRSRRPGAGRDAHRRRLGQGRGRRGGRRRTCRRACISSPATRSPAPSSPGPTPASPSCSTTAGAS